jgi:hypothetical protein
MGLELFETRREAEAVKNGMLGWRARVVRWTDVDLDTQKVRKVWVIECREAGASKSSMPLYLREDGYVR